MLNREFTSFSLKCQFKTFFGLNDLFKVSLTMNFLEIMKLFPNIKKLSKVWEYNYNEIMYYGSGNASGRLRFTNHHHPDGSVRN